MPTFVGPTQSGLAWRGVDPPGQALFRHYGTLTEGVNVYILTDGTVTETDPIDWSTVAHTLWGAHIETVTDAEAALLLAAGYGEFLVGFLPPSLPSDALFPSSSTLPGAF